MKVTRRILSWVLAIAMVITCGITGLVLPASANTEPVDLLNGQGTFEDGTDYTQTALGGFQYTAGAYAVVDNPAGDGKVLQLGKFVDEDSDGINDGTYTHNSYPKWKKLYDAEKGTYTKAMEAGKTYTVSFDVYGDAIGYFFDAHYEVLSENAEAKVGSTAGWYKVGGAEAWKTYTFTFYPEDNIYDAYNTDWWSWGNCFNKGSNNYSGTAGFTYIDNFTIVETQATAIALDVESVALEPGDKTEAPVVTTTPVRSAYAAVVYTTDKAEVATVDAATGVITAVGLGTATITATAGELTDTITVKVQDDKTQSWADLSNAKYATGTNRNQPAVVRVDEATGLEYVSVSESDQVAIPNWIGTVGKDQWVGLTFLTRVTDGSNNTGAVRAGVQMQSIVEGYCQPEFYARTATMGGDWMRVTFYAKTYYTSNSPSFQFLTLAKPTNAAATYSYDIADVSVFLPEADDVNLAGYGADFEDGYVIHTLGDNTQSALPTKADVAIVNDPTGADNKVFFVSTAAAASNAGTYWYGAQYAYHDAEGTRFVNRVFETGKMYKISFRVYSANNVTIDSYGGGVFKGTSGTAAKSGQWRQVTTYMYTTSSFNAAYALHVRFGSGPAYIDDIEIYECVDATGFEVKGDTEMTIGESQTLDIVSVPKHSYPGTLTTTVDGTGLTLSGTTVTAAAVTGVEVKGGTVTVTSNLTDGDGNPITGSIAIKVNYPEEHFVNGTMDTGALDGLTFTGAGTHAVDGAYAFGLDGVGINGTKGAAIYSTGAKYFKGQSFKLKPNSVYVFQAYARANGTGAKLELNLVTGNNNSGNKIVTITNSGYSDARGYVDTQWTHYAMYVMTGETTTTMDSNWNLYFQARALPTVEGDETPAIFLDNISLQLVSEGDNHFTGYSEPIGFEEGETEYFTPHGHSFTTDMLAEGEGLNGSTALKIANDRKGTTYIIKSTPGLDSHAIYKLSFWSKADQQFIDEGGKMALYWGATNAGALYLQSQTNSGSFYATTEWKLNEFILVTNGRNLLPTNTFYFDTSKTTVGTGNIYFDDVKLECIAADNFLSADQTSTAQTMSIDGGETWHSYLTNVEPGTKVQVRNYQFSGRVMVPGSLKVTQEDGTVTKILNKDYANGYTKDNFGVGDGRIFEFIMPETSGRVTATFTNDADNTFNMDTVGTSLRYTDGENFDGIRFLTRMNLGVDKVKVTNGEMTLNVKYNGTDYTVVEIGSYLMRYAEGTELTAENAKWTAVSYKAGETDMKLLDYTGQYIDFASVMLKGAELDQEVFNARKYTARGYIVLEDAEGGQVTVLANEQTSASVNEIAPLV